MQLIKFNNDLKHYYDCVNCSYDNNLATIEGIVSYPKNIDGGFSVYEYINEEKTETKLLQDLSEYNLLWEEDKDNNVLIFSNDDKVYKTYFIYNEDGFITDEITTIDTILNNVLLVDEGIGRSHQEFPHIELFDEDGFYLYKVVDGQKVNTTSEEKENWEEEKRLEELAQAKEDKKQEISDTCKEKIVSGVDVNNLHYTYTIEDQNNIYNSMNLAIQTGLEVPYHAMNENCRLYTKEELIAIYIAGEMNVTSQVTYSNQMIQYIDTLQTIEEVEAIKYGTPLTGQYLKNYNTMMNQAREIIKHITNTDIEE